MDISTKLRKIDLGIENFRADILQFPSTTVEIFFIGDRLGSS